MDIVGEESLLREHEARVRNVAAQLAWLRQECERDGDLGFLGYLLGMAEHEARHQMDLLAPTPDKRRPVRTVA